MPSESDTESLIRAVLVEQADRAPHRATVLAGLRRRRRPHRGSAVVLVGVAVALVAICVPLGLHLVDVMAASRVPPPDLMLRDQVTWLPAGFVATERTVPLDSQGNETQTWRLNGSAISLNVYPTTDNWTPNGTQVSINGRPGILFDYDHMTSVTWSSRPHERLEVTLYGVADQDNAALRVARSVRPGGGKLAQPFVFGYLPPRDTDRSLTVSRSSTGWTAQRSAGTPLGPQIMVTWSATPPTLTGATPVTVHGRPGWYLPSQRPDDDPTIQVLLDGRWLVVDMALSGSSTEAELVRIANGITVYPTVAFPWLGP
jgi:hypothetical protein